MGAYLSLDEFKTAPTSVDLTNLQVDPAPDIPADQDSALTRVIARAGQAMDDYTSNPLVSTTRTETRRVRVNRDGWFSIHPTRWPVVALTAFSYGSSVAQLNTVTDLTGQFIDEQNVLLPLGGSSTFAGSGLTLGGPRPGAPYVARYSYTHGFPATTITNSPAAGGTSLTVADASGFVVGNRYTLFDGMNSANETVTVSAINGTTLTVSALVFAHAAGVAISGLPESVKQAALLYTIALIRTRGDSSMVLSAGLSTPDQVGGTDRSLLADIRLAQELLRPWRRVR